jgi:XapX domain-containing protein
MTVVSSQRSKIALGLLLGLAIGAPCSLLGIPSPAPSVLPGALLVFAMTSGHAATDWWLGPDEAQHRDKCGGPDGSIKDGS